MITVKKGNLQTQVNETMIDRYTSQGWEIVGEPKNEPKTDEVKAVVEKLDTKLAAENRGQTVTDDPVTQAEAIVATETRKFPQKPLNTGLVKPKAEKPVAQPKKETAEPDKETATEKAATK